MMLFAATNVDSKREFFEPSDVQASLRCAMLITNACYRQTLAINNWNTMVSRYGQKKYLSESWKSANYLVRLHERRWVNKFCIAAHDMEGLDGHCFSNLHYNILPRASAGHLL